jgi:carbonic anhydrase
MAWLSHTEATRRVVKENYADLDEGQLLNIAIQENVLVQLENLRTHPAVASRLSHGELNLHGWTYKIETGEVFSYQPKEGQFLPLTEAPVGRERQQPSLAPGSSI